MLASPALAQGNGWKSGGKDGELSVWVRPLRSLPDGTIYAEELWVCREYAGNCIYKSSKALLGRVYDCSAQRYRWLDETSWARVEPGTVMHGNYLAVCR
jgi:hypothetical protein